MLMAENSIIGAFISLDKDAARKFVQIRDKVTVKGETMYLVGGGKKFKEASLISPKDIIKFKVEKKKKEEDEETDDDEE